MAYEDKPIICIKLGNGKRYGQLSKSKDPRVKAEVGKSFRIESSATGKWFFSKEMVKNNIISET